MHTNENSLVKQAVMGEVSHPLAGTYRTTFEGRPRIVPGMYGVKLNFRVGDPAYGHVSDHLEPGVCIVNPGSVRQHTALNAFACIGNEARVVSGDAKGASGVVTGKHGWQNTFIDFTPEVLGKLVSGDKVQVTGWGTGLAIEGYEDLRFMSMSPRLFKVMRVEDEGSSLTVPVVMEVPGRMMGSGMGGGTGGIPELGDFDVQSTCPELTKRHGLSRLRIGDIVAIRDMLAHYARGIHPGAVTIAVVSHGASGTTGHGPGCAPIISSPPGRINPVTDERANVACLLGLRPDVSW
jgi:hypothetical protein